MSVYSGRVLCLAAVAAVAVCAYGAGVRAGSSADRPDPPRPRPLLDDAAARLEREAFEPVRRADLEKAAVAAMVHRLDDPWAKHYSAAAFDDVRGRLEGGYSGVGLWLGGAPGRRVRVASVQPDSPAARAGVRPGDVVTRVGSGSVDGWDVRRVALALRGTGPVDLAVDRRGRVLRFTLDRRITTGGDMSTRGLSGGGRLIRVGAFSRGVGQRIRAAVDDRAAGGGILLDLRGNPGGLLTEAVESASAFLPGGTVVTYEQRGRPTRRYPVTAPGDARTPLVVLVDGGTASAAEIVAGSLRDRERAVLVGSPTYGKGSVQETVRLPDGSAIELTVGRYRTPSGRNLDGAGIDPDVAVSADRPPPEAEQRAHTVLRGLLATLPEKDRG